MIPFPDSNFTDLNFQINSYLLIKSCSNNIKEYNFTSSTETLNKLASISTLIENFSEIYKIYIYSLVVKLTLLSRCFRKTIEFESKN